MIYPFTCATPRMNWLFTKTTMTRVAGTDEFYKTVAGVSGLSVTASIYDDTGTLLETGAAIEADAADIPGAYYYEFDTDNITTSGYYKTVAAVALSSDVDEPVLTEYIWVGQSGVGVTSGSGSDLSDTLTSLLGMLRIRLNDVDQGNYSAVELQYCLNLAYRETVVASLCHRATATIALVAAQHTYTVVDATDAYIRIFDPIDVMIGAQPLVRRSMGDMGVGLDRWHSEAPGVPTEWMHLTGNQIRLHPAPSTDAVGAISSITTVPIAKGTGYVVGDTLSVSSGTDGTVRVTQVSTGGVVESLELVTSGTGYTTGTNATTGGTGSACTVAVATIGKLTVNGYAAPTPLLLATDTPTAVPSAHAIQAILDRAEAEARKCRITTSQNAMLYERLMGSWRTWCEKIRETARGNA